MMNQIVIVQMLLFFITDVSLFKVDLCGFGFSQFGLGRAESHFAKCFDGSSEAV